MDRQIKHNLTGQPGYDWGMTDKPFLTIGEVADILQVSSRTVYNLIYKGTLRACRLTYHITIITKEDFFLMIRETPHETLFMLISIECVKNTATIQICRIIQIHIVFRFSFIVPFCTFIVLD